MAASPTPPSADRRAGTGADDTGVTPPRVAVATSGGRDSTALLHVTARAMAALGGEVHALHVHHGLNPAADEWQAALTRQCRRWARAGLPIQLHRTRLATAPAAGDSIEAWARRERYVALGRMFATGPGSDVGVPGPETVRLFRDLLPQEGGPPVITVGGITAANAGQVAEAGADGICAMAAITQADDPRAATAGLVEAFAKDT